MATFLPLDLPAMRGISGVGDLKLEKYGADFLQEIRNFCKRKGLPSQIDQKERKRERRSRTKRDRIGDDTYSISLRMFRWGMTIPDIARERSLTESTIEGHLARFIVSGKLRVEDVVEPEKIPSIVDAFSQIGSDDGIGKIKEMLGDDYTFGEIRAVAADIERHSNLVKTIDRMQPNPRPV